MFMSGNCGMQQSIRKTRITQIPADFQSFQRYNSDENDTCVHKYRYLLKEGIKMIESAL